LPFIGANFQLKREAGIYNWSMFELSEFNNIYYMIDQLDELKGSSL
jgi:hypothetical protein